MVESKDHKFRAAQSLHQLLPRLDRLMREIDRENGATGAQLSALAAVSELRKDRLHLLAKHEGVSKPTMSRIVSALVNKGWLSKEVDELDNRTPILVVSSEGRDVLERCCAARTELLRQTLERVDDESCKVLYKVLARMVLSLR